MALAAYAFLLAGAHRFAFTLLVLAWMIIAISVYKHGLFDGKSRLLQTIYNALVCAAVGVVFSGTWYLLVPEPPSSATQLPSLGRPSFVVHDVRFALLSDTVVRQLHKGGEAFEIEFILRNSTSPPKEIHNVFANLWIDGQHFIQSIPAPLRDYGSARVEWDLNLPVLPKDSVLVDLPKLSVRMPTPGDEVTVGAQIVADEIDKKEYLWKVVNDNGLPKIIFVKDPDRLR